MITTTGAPFQKWRVLRTGTGRSHVDGAPPGRLTADRAPPDLQNWIDNSLRITVLCGDLSAETTSRRRAPRGPPGRSEKMNTKAPDRAASAAALAAAAALLPAAIAAAQPTVNGARDAEY